MTKNTMTSKAIYQASEFILQSDCHSVGIASFVKQNPSRTDCIKINLILME